MTNLILIAIAATIARRNENTFALGKIEIQIITVFISTIAIIITSLTGAIAYKLNIITIDQMIATIALIAITFIVVAIIRKVNS